MSNRTRPPPEIESPAAGVHGASGNKGNGNANTPAGQNIQPRICEKCGNTFQPRKGSGGKPQRFCSTACRKGTNVRPNANPNGNCTEDIGEDVGEDVGNLTLAPTIKPDEDSGDFRWNDDNSIVLQEQRRTAIYFNPNDDLVIRQEADWNEDEDHVVIVCKNNIQEFLDRITDICGIPSAP